MTIRLDCHGQFVLDKVGLSQKKTCLCNLNSVAKFNFQLSVTQDEKLSKIFM